MGKEFSHLQFTIPEILSLIGLVQCVYILVYMAFRAGRFSRIVLPALYFLVLGAAFFLDFAARGLSGLFPFYNITEWAFWFLGPPLSVLLMIQIARITELPSIRSYWVLTLLPLAVLAGLSLRKLDYETSLIEILTLTGFLAGVISLFAMGSQRSLLTHLKSQPGGRDRYWLIVAIVLVNLFFLATMLLSLTSALTAESAKIIRTIWGLGFVYLAGTSLFRIYPQAVLLMERPVVRHDLTAEETAIAHKIERLLNMDKVYQEASYNRVNLAQELGVSETQISRIINHHFGKTLPQLFNERRVEDAKRLLLETDSPVKTIAAEVGFNSIASFNRVFKELENLNPGQFRERHGKAQDSL